MHNKDRYLLLESSLQPSVLFEQKDHNRTVNPGTTFTLKNIETGDETEVRVNIEKISKIDNTGRYSFTGFLSQKLRAKDGFYPEVTEITGCLSDRKDDACGILISKEFCQDASYFPSDKEISARKRASFELLLYNRFRHMAAISNT